MGRASRGKKDRRFQRNHPKPFQHMALSDVAETRACGRPYHRSTVKRDICPVCEVSVFLHCADCEIQITGCLCTAIARMTPDDLARFKSEVAARRARETGLIIPNP